MEGGAGFGLLVGHFGGQGLQMERPADLVEGAGVDGCVAPQRSRSSPSRLDIKDAAALCQELRRGMGDCLGGEGAHLCPLAESVSHYRRAGEKAPHPRPASEPSGRHGDVSMFPDTAVDSPSFNEVRRALQSESQALEVAHEEAEASPSLHVEVEEEGARDSGNGVQWPAPVISNTTADPQLHPASLVDTPMDAVTTLDVDMLRSSLDPGQEERRSRGRGRSEPPRSTGDCESPETCCPPCTTRFEALNQALSQQRRQAAALSRLLEEQRGPRGPLGGRGRSPREALPSCPQRLRRSPKTRPLGPRPPP